MLDQEGERLLSLSAGSRRAARAYAALSTADRSYPTVTLSTGAAVQVTYGQYRALLATTARQADRAAAFHALYDDLRGHLNTYASLYNGVMQRDWFGARARGYGTHARGRALRQRHPDGGRREPDRETKAGVGPFRRYHRLRKRVLGSTSYTSTTPRSAGRGGPAVPLRRSARWIVESVAPLGADYQARVREAFEAGGSTSTRTRGSAAAPIRRPSTACIRTCC